MKRIIFALLYRNGSYVLSRNFRLQRIGDIGWVLENYGILEVSQGIDELMILDVSTRVEAREQFRREVAILADECFVPVTVGGGINAVEEADRLFAAGADKVLVNAALVRAPGLVVDLATRFGSQAVVGGCDVSSEPMRTPEARRDLVVDRLTLSTRLMAAADLGVGEVCIQSVDRDGTGNGLDLGLASDSGGVSVKVPLILMGGVGRANHLLEGLRTPQVDAVATANLLNFVGDALVRARATVIEAGVDLPSWSSAALRTMKGAFGSQGDAGSGPIPTGDGV